MQYKKPVCYTLRLRVDPVAQLARLYITGFKFMANEQFRMEKKNWEHQYALISHAMLGEGGRSDCGAYPKPRRIVFVVLDREV